MRRRNVFQTALRTAAALTAILTLAGPAAALTDGSFESGGLGSWLSEGDALVTGSPDLGSAPTDGIFQLLLSTLTNGSGLGPLGGQAPFSGTAAATDATIETNLGFQAGTLDGLSPNGNPAVEGSAVSQSITVLAGHVLEFDWNFLTNEPPPTTTYTDFFFWLLVPAGDTVPIFSEVLADTNSSTFAASTALDFANETGYQTRSYTFAQSGTFDLVLGVSDVNDDNYASGVLLDRFSVVTPEPSSGVLLLIGLAGLGLRRDALRRA